jgi:hypothetical protein
MSLKKTPNAFAKFTAAVHRGVDLRDKRDAALKAAAAALATLEATMESDTATRDDFDAAKVEYEETVVVLVDPIIRVCGQPFTVYGLLRTTESASPLASPAVASSLIAFVIVYFAVFSAGVIYILRMMAAPPHHGEQGPRGDPAPASPSYRECLFGWFKNHPAGREGTAANSARFESFVRAQLFWDCAMAEAIARACRDRPRALAVGIMGRGHIEYGDGVPHQLAAVGINNIATALPWSVDIDCPRRNPPIADLLFGIAPAGDCELPLQ